MTLRTVFSSYRPYLAWLAVSAAALLTARATDPYVFGLVAFCAAGLSIGLLAISTFCGARAMLWAAAGAMPTAAAFWLLSTYHWA